MNKVDDNLEAMYMREHDFLTRQVEEEEINCYFCNQTIIPDNNGEVQMLGKYPCCMNRDCIRDAGIEYELDKEYLSDEVATDELTFNEYVMNELYEFKQVIK